MIRSRPICTTCVNITELCIFRAVSLPVSAFLTLIRDNSPNGIHLVHSCYGDIVFTVKCELMFMYCLSQFHGDHGGTVVKVKSVPLKAWSGPEGSRKLRFPDFVTTVQGGNKVVSLTHRPHLPPENPPGTHFC